MLNKKTVANVLVVTAGVMLAGIIMAQIPDAPGIRESRFGFGG